jgi:hypothetical protein
VRGLGLAPVHGLAGDRQGVYTKVHHAAIDGCVRERPAGSSRRGHRVGVSALVVDDPRRPGRIIGDLVHPDVTAPGRLDLLDPDAALPAEDHVLITAPLGGGPGCGRRAFSAPRTSGGLGFTSVPSRRPTLGETFANLNRKLDPISSTYALVAASDVSANYGSVATRVITSVCANSHSGLSDRYDLAHNNGHRTATMTTYTWEIGGHTAVVRRSLAWVGS